MAVNSSIGSFQTRITAFSASAAGRATESCAVAAGPGTRNAMIKRPRMNVDPRPRAGGGTTSGVLCQLCKLQSGRCIVKIYLRIGVAAYAARIDASNAIKPSVSVCLPTYGPERPLGTSADPPSPAQLAVSYGPGWMTDSSDDRILRESAPENGAVADIHLGQLQMLAI